MDERRIIEEIENFYREYFNFTKEEEAFLILYYSLLRKGGKVSGRILCVPANVKKLRNLKILKDKLLREVRR